MIVTSMEEHTRALQEHCAVLKAKKNEDKLAYFSTTTGEEICYHNPLTIDMIPEDKRKEIQFYWDNQIGMTHEPINTRY